MRELALYEFQTGNKSKALKYIRKSRNVFNLENSNIAIWIEELITIHEDFIDGRLQNEKQYFQRLQHLKFIDHVFSHRENNLLLKVRYYSPYWRLPLMSMYNPPDPGQFIKEVYLEELGISEREVAHKLKVAPSTFHRLVAGKISLTPEMALRLSKTLGRTPES